MRTQRQLDLVRHLWPDGAGPEAPQVYALLDGSGDDAIATKVTLSGLPACCLYAGDLSPALRRAAPYLVQLSPSSSLFGDLAHAAWGRAWGVYATAPPDISLQALRRHLRQWLRVAAPDGRHLVFRFYDPRVLRVFLPGCTRDETRQFFGPVSRLILEEEDASKLLMFTHNQGQLHAQHGAITPGCTASAESPSPAAVRTLPGIRASMTPELASLNGHGFRFRRPVRGDGAALAQATQDRLASDRMWDDVWPMSEEEAETWIAEHALSEPPAQRYRLWSLLIRDPADDMVLGMLYLYWPDRADASTVEIAFWIRASAQGRGLARQAVRIVADWLFAETSASQLRLHISERNVRSQHVARACGFQMQRQCAGVRRYALLA